MAPFDLSSRHGRLTTYLDYLWNDHAWLRLGFENAHWLDTDMVRSCQLWPFQLERWKKSGIRTVINLRGGFDASFYALERDACERLGLDLVEFIITSREVPSRERVLGARDLFASIQYPAMMHCKSGADRAGIMSVFYRHFRMGEPIRIARKELAMRYMHMKAGKTGVLDYVFERYLTDAEPLGMSFIDWVESPMYQPDAIKADFKEEWWGSLITEKLLRRE